MKTNLSLIPYTKRLLGLFEVFEPPASKAKSYHLRKGPFAFGMWPQDSAQHYK
jgi:hypothetical protein